MHTDSQNLGLLWIGYLKKINILKTISCLKIFICIGIHVYIEFLTLFNVKEQQYSSLYARDQLIRS